MALPLSLPAQRKELLEEVVKLLEHPRFAPVFGPGSRSEVSLAGEFDGRAGRVFLSARVDRLSISDGEVLLIDFKTARYPPERLADVPEEYITQLAVYRRLLARLYPGRRIHAGLLWTAAPRLVELPEEMLADAERRLG
jgi:ATP-dependent helicase/nuclease subunit A